MMSAQKGTENMPHNIDQARDDLAFLSGILAERKPALYGAGLLYGWAGILYGLQCLIAWIAMVIPGGMPGILHLANGILPTVIFIGICIWAARASKVKGHGKGATTRALSGVFQGAGIANFALVAVFALAAFRRQDYTIWLFYPVSVCALQGAVWYGAAVIRKRMWMGAVAIGWLLAAIVASLFIEAPKPYLAVLGISLFGLMGIPGYVMMRISRTGEASA